MLANANAALLGSCLLSNDQVLKSKYYDAHDEFHFTCIVTHITYHYTLSYV
jgi:hypothetical protein